MGVETLHTSSALLFASGFDGPTVDGVHVITASGHDYSSIPATGGGVPEPAIWAMLIAGFGLVGAMARRRRATVA